MENVCAVCCVLCAGPQGALREALDTRRLPRLPGSALTHPCIALALAHDVAAAMLHLHSEGIM
jgi:hypothetical protein